MATAADAPAWIALFLGLYLLAAAAAELREMGTWNAMLAEFERSPALRFVTGVIALAIGAAIYLASPWRPGDWLSVVVSLIGGVAIAEGLLLLAMGDRFLAFARALVIRFGRGWAGFAALAGAALVLAGLAHLPAF